MSGIALGIGLAAGLMVSAVAAAADRDAVLRAIAEMMPASRAMVADHEREDLTGMGADATRVIEAGERALEALPKPGNRHARDAAEHVREAMESARLAAEAAAQGHSDDASTHARRTLSHVRQATGHAEAL
jgi:hypothetical protein